MSPHSCVVMLSLSEARLEPQAVAIGEFQIELGAQNPQLRQRWGCASKDNSKLLGGGMLRVGWIVLTDPAYLRRRKSATEEEKKRRHVYSLTIVYFPYSRLITKSRKYGKIINLSERSHD